MTSPSSPRTSGALHLERHLHRAGDGLPQSRGGSSGYAAPAVGEAVLLAGHAARLLDAPTEDLRGHEPPRDRTRHPMDGKELKELQAPLKARYRETPRDARITLRAKGSIDDSAIVCKVDTGRALAIAGLHPATGGTGLELCSGDMLLEALVACAGVTLKAVATALEVPLEGAEVFAEGDLDFRGTLGVDKNARVGFETIRLRFAVKSDAEPEKLDQLLKLTERYCVVLQTLRGGAKVTASLRNQ